MRERDKPWYFVVRITLGVEHYALEFGDQKRTQHEIRQKDQRSTTRYELPAGYEPTLDEAIRAYKRGARPKPIPRPPRVEPRTYNSVRAARASRT